MKTIECRMQNAECRIEKRFLRSAFCALHSAFIVSVATAANACPVCFGDPTAPSAKGMNNAIWFLLAMVGFIQIGFGALFVTFWRRARALRRRRESFQVLDGGVR
jgi:hypothetical protein